MKAKPKPAAESLPQAGEAESRLKALPSVTIEAAYSPIAAASPFDLPIEVFAAGLERRRQNRHAIMNWLRGALVEGTDYGRIHMAGKDKCVYARSGQAELCQTPGHWSGPSLFKTGAEKICGMLGITVHFPKLDDYERAALDGLSLRQIILRCELRDGQGHTVAEGVGARNLQQDYGDLNKSLKMAEKSALIDATLRLAGLSEVFAQDLEIAEIPMTAMSGDEQEPAPSLLSAAQLEHLEQRIEALKLDRSRVLIWLERATKGQVKNFEQLTAALLDQVLAKLETFAADAPAR